MDPDGKMGHWSARPKIFFKEENEEPKVAENERGKGNGNGSG